MPQDQALTPHTNVGILERVISAGAGGLLVRTALRKPSPARLLAAAAGGDLLYRAFSGHCAIYGALGLNTAAVRRPGSAVKPNAPQVTRSITIGRSPEELYAFLRQPRNLAHIMAHFAKVTAGPDGITHWRARGALGQVLEWNSRHIEDAANRELSWQSTPDSAFPNNGKIRFRPAPNGVGAEVTLHIQFEPPLGAVGATVVHVLHRVPRSIAGESLRRFKSLVETGEIPSLENNPSGRGASGRF